MMEHLEAEQGDEVMFEIASLPPGEFIQLQPTSFAWLVSNFWSYLKLGTG